MEGADKKCAAPGIGRRLKFDRLVKFAAVRAAGTVHIRIIGVNVTALLAAEDLVLARGGFEVSLAEFLIDPHGTECAQQDGDIAENKFRKRHFREWRKRCW